MSNYNKTPILQTLREKGGTLYVFPSASEDIGTNLNSRTNSVSLSHYALLNIPKANTKLPTDTKKVTDNLFNVTFIPGQFDEFNNSNSNMNDGTTDANSASWQIATSLQNYAMNFETHLINETDYNYQDLDTVSERVFFKWLKETGAIQWKTIETSTGKFVQNSKNNSSYYYLEGDDMIGTNYNKVVQCFGAIDSGNNLSTDFGMFNETYINIPSSYGNGTVFFESINSNNYKLGRTYVINTDEYLEGRNDDDNNSLIYTVNKPFTDTLGAGSGTDGNLSQNTYMTVNDVSGTWYGGNSDTASKAYYTQKTYDPTLDTSITSTIKYYNGNELEAEFRRSNLDGIEIVKDLNDIQKIWKTSNLIDDYSKSLISINSYDDINIDKYKIYNTENEFNFNAILLYYSLYNQNDSTKTAIATNLFGILFLNAPVSNITQTGFALDFNIPTINKKKSTEDGFGTGYSFRVNIKTLSVYDNTDAIINDNTTSNSLYGEDFNSVISLLNTAIDNMNINVGTTKSIQDQYAKLMSVYGNQMLTIEDLSTKLNSYVHGNRSSVLNTSILNAQHLRSGDSLENQFINFEVPIYYDNTNNKMVYSSTLMSIDSSKVKIYNTLDTSDIKSENTYTLVTKYDKDSKLLDASVDTEDNKEIVSLLENLFDSPNGDLNIVYTDYNNDYVRLNSTSTEYLAPTQRIKELIIDPDSIALKNGNLNYIIKDHIEGLSNDNGNYETAYIDNTKLVPYIIAYLQNFNSTIDEKVLSSSLFTDFEKNINDQVLDISNFVNIINSSVQNAINTIDDHIDASMSWSNNSINYKIGNIANKVDIPVATNSVDGIMSKNDKLLLNELVKNAVSGTETIYSDADQDGVKDEVIFYNPESSIYTYVFETGLTFLNSSIEVDNPSTKNDASFNSVITKSTDKKYLVTIDTFNTNVSSFTLDFGGKYYNTDVSISKTFKSKYPILYGVSNLDLINYQGENITLKTLVLEKLDNHIITFDFNGHETEESAYGYLAIPYNFAPGNIFGTHLIDSSGTLPTGIVDWPMDVKNTPITFIKKEINPSLVNYTFGPAINGPSNRNDASIMLYQFKINPITRWPDGSDTPTENKKYKIKF